MLDRIVQMPDQLGWALEQNPAAGRFGRDVMVAGMGGSAMAGDVAAVVAAQHGARIAVHRGYELPPWMAASHEAPGPLIAVSYSGNTEETISAVESAAARGAQIGVVASGGALEEMARRDGWPMVTVPGGLQPRAALAYQAGALLQLLVSGGTVPDQRSALEEAAVVTRELIGSTGDGAGAVLAADLAEGLDGRITLVYASRGIGSVAARRWKTQINENAKQLAYWSEVPELDHNELEGWGAVTPRVLRSVGIVALRDSGDHPRVAKRMSLSLEVLGTEAPVVGEVGAHGEGPLARLFSLIAVGDLTSVVMAQRAGVDPTPVALLEAFKTKMRDD